MLRNLYLAPTLVLLVLISPYTAAIHPDGVDFVELHGYAKNLGYPKYAHSDWEHKVYVLTIVLIILLVVLVLSIIPLAILSYMLYDDTSLMARSARKVRNNRRRNNDLIRNSIPENDSYFPMNDVPPSPMGPASMMGGEMPMMPPMNPNGFYQ